jgi:DNA-binding phage protein
MTEAAEGRFEFGVTEMAERLTDYDPAEDLIPDVAIATFIAEALASDDVCYIAHALWVAARAKDISEIV